MVLTVDDALSASLQLKLPLELDYEDYFNPSWFNDEPFVEEAFVYGEISVIICGLAWNTVQSGAGYNRIGHTLWAAGHFLADFLYHHSDILQGKRVLEIGCGLGLTGLLAGKLVDNPRNIFLTDGDKNILDALQRNIDRNFPRVEQNGLENQDDGNQPTCSVLVWGEDVEKFRNLYGQFDLIIGADVLYSENSLEPLVSTLCLLLNSKVDSVILLAFQTQYGGRFRDSFQRIVSENRLVGEQLDWTSSEVKLLKSLNDDRVALELWKFYRRP